MVYKDNVAIDMHEGEIGCKFYLYIFLTLAVLVGGIVGVIAVHPAIIIPCLIFYWIYSCCC